MLRNLDLWPSFFVVIFLVICLTVTNLSGILDTMDTSFLQPWFLSSPACTIYGDRDISDSENET